MTTFKPSATDLAKIAARALGDIQEPSENRGLRLHLINSKRSTNGRTVCRLWHPDGVIVGAAGGWGYDRAGAALGNALFVLLPDDIQRISPDCYCARRDTDGRIQIDGSCGMSSLIYAFASIGLEIETFDTSDHAQIVFIRRIR